MTDVRARRLAGGALVVGIALAAMQGIDASPTTGGVNFLDPLGYTKPAFYPINLPVPGANRYWVDLGSGRGTSCTTAPCSLTTVQGNPGLAAAAHVS